MLTLANTITADMGMIPGLAFVGPAMGLPLSVLAAFVERPFYTLAGVKRHTIWYSLQANLVSLGVGFLAALRTRRPPELKTILVLTGDLAPDGVSQATSLGADALIPKPVQLQTILTAIRHHHPQSPQP